MRTATWWVRSSLVIVVGVAALVALLAPVGTGAVDAAVSPSLTIAPLTGPAGTTIQVSGTGCPDPTWDTSLHWTVHVQTQHPGSAPAALVVTPPSGTPTTPIGFTTEGYPGRAEATAVPASDGTWSASLNIPADGSFAAPPGEYQIGALCFATEGTEAGTVSYAAQAFTVLAPPTPPTAPPPFTG